LREGNAVMAETLALRVTVVPGPSDDLKTGAGGTNRYPTPQTVWRNSGSAGSTSIFMRMRRT